MSCVKEILTMLIACTFVLYVGRYLSMSTPFYGFFTQLKLNAKRRTLTCMFIAYVCLIVLLFILMYPSIMNFGQRLRALFELTKYYVLRVIYYVRCAVEEL